MYEIVDINGGCSGVPVWMTEAHWRNLELSSRSRVALRALREVQGLLESLKKASSESEELSLEGVSDANSKTKGSPMETRSN